MTLLRRNLTIAAGAAVTAGLTWAVASGVVELHPATLGGTVTLPGPIDYFYAYAYGPDGQASQKLVDIPTGAAAPYSFALLVDGGDPAVAGDGVGYRPAIQAFLPSASGVGPGSYLYIQRGTSEVVDNTPEEPSASVSVAFSYPVLHTINPAVAVNHGTITSVSFQAYANNGPLQESYQASAGQGYGSPPPAVALAMPMIPSSSVTIYGSVSLLGDDGTASQRQLAAQTVDLSAGAASVEWAIDLSNTGTLEGTIAFAMPPGSVATPAAYYLYYEGASSATSGIYGNVQATPSAPTFSAALSPGDYNVYLRTYLNTPSQWFDTRRERVTVEAGKTVVKDFARELGTVRRAVTIGGFFTAANLSYLDSALGGPQLDNFATSSAPSGGVFEHAVAPGIWRPYYVSLGLHDQSNPALPLSAQIYRYNYPDPHDSPATVPPGGTASLATNAFTLVRSNIYFDVVEPAGAPPILIANPGIQAFRAEENPDHTTRSYNYAYASGSSTPQALSGFTMVAEPGVYTFTAQAYVNGEYTRFPGTSITFGEPVATGSGQDVGVTLTPAQNPELRIDLGFSDVASPGVTTVVETPLGPAPPQGLKTLCEHNEFDLTCDPVYYDISTTAVPAGPISVCVRRLVRGVSNGARDFLFLYHYNDHLAAGPVWERLPLPEGMTGAIDCGSGDPADLAACNCASEASCNIDVEATPPRDAFLVCGVTTSFSIVSILQGTVELDNRVNGVAYAGPTGPPSLQQWTVLGDGTYRITATGAAGARASDAPGPVQGGCGAEVAGDFALHAGDVVQFLVGQKGTGKAKNAGGGGGTFVTRNGAPLLIAGGGGGVGVAAASGRNGSAGSAGVPGSRSSDYSGSYIAGGNNGSGGARILGFGAGGGGWSGNGASDGNNGDGGWAFLGSNQGRGGGAKACGEPAHGGYGGGGSGNGCFGAGGGGGYSGGGGGRIAGGGGSINHGSNPAAREGICTVTGHGKASIDLVID